MHQNHQKKEYMVERGSLIRLVISLENNSNAVTKCQIFDSFDTHSRDFFFNVESSHFGKRQHGKPTITVFNKRIVSSS